MAADGDAIAAQRIGLAGAAAAAADDEAGLFAGHRGQRVWLAVLLAGHEAHGGRRLGLLGDEAGATAGAEGGSLRVLEAALWAEHVRPRERPARPLGLVVWKVRLLGDLVVRHALAGEYARQAGHVVGRDDRLTLGVLAMQAHHELGAQDVQLALQDAPLARDLALVGLELGDEGAQLLVGT